MTLRVRDDREPIGNDNVIFDWLEEKIGVIGVVAVLLAVPFLVIVTAVVVGFNK